MSLIRNLCLWFSVCLGLTAALPALCTQAQTIGPAELFLDRFTDPVVGNNIFIPTGIETDLDDNVWVYDSTSTGSDVVRKYTPQGQFLGGVQVHSLFTVATPGGYLARDPVTGSLFMLLTDGEMRSLEPVTGRMTTLFDLRQLPIDTSTIYDIATSRSVANSGGLIVPPFQWGDFAVRADERRTDFFISGRAPAHVFILRVQFEQGVLVSAKTLVF